MGPNIKKLYVSNFLVGLVFWYSIEKLFMHSIHIDNFGIALCAITFVVVSLIFNIPTGILADKWSRKYTLILATIALAVGSIILGYSHSLSTYLIGTAIYALFVTLSSGTYQAVTYDSLAETNHQHLYTKHQGRSYGMFLAGVGISSAMGGYMAHAFGYRSTYFITLISCVVNLGILLTMHEPKFHKEIEDTKLRSHIKRTISIITAERFLLYLCLLFVSTSLLLSTQNEYAGLYFIALGFGAIGNGWANAGKWIAGSAGQFLAQKIGAHTKILIPAFFLAFLAFTIYRSPFGLIFFYLATFIQAIVSTNIENTIQDNTPSSIRATMLSVVGFVGSAVLIPVSLVFGTIARNNVFDAYLFVAMLGILALIIWYLRPQRVNYGNSTDYPL